MAAKWTKKIIEFAEKIRVDDLCLEDYEEWMGEKPPYKWIVLSRGRHIFYGNTLEDLEKGFAYEQLAQKTLYKVSPANEIYKIIVVDGRLETQLVPR